MPKKKTDGRPLVKVETIEQRAWECPLCGHYNEGTWPHLYDIVICQECGKECIVDQVAEL